METQVVPTAMVRDVHKRLYISDRAIPILHVVLTTASYVYLGLGLYGGVVEYRFSQTTQLCVVAVNNHRSIVKKSAGLLRCLAFWPPSIKAN